MKRMAKIAAIVVSVIGFLALASYVTTGGLGGLAEGGFAAGEFRLTVTDPAGKPVEGAILRIYRHGTRSLAFGYPLDNHLAGQDLVSDKNGRITVIRKWGGISWGVKEWDLFWIIPMGDNPPDFDCEISAKNFETHRFSIWQLCGYDGSLNGHEVFPGAKLTVDGKEIELRVYWFAFTLTPDS
jgi:hypothetical protein